MDRFIQIKVSDRAAIVIESIRDRAEFLAGMLDDLPNSREKSLAITKLEECVMWANKCASHNMQ